MELRVITSSDQELEIEIGGEDHTFMNLLKGVLLDTPGIEAATYDMNPEQSGGQTDPVLTIETETGTDPLDALAEAAGTVRDEAEAFREAFDEAVAAAA